MNNHGFSLFELSVALVILIGLFSAMIIGVSNIVGKISRSAFESSTKMVLTRLEYEALSDDKFKLDKSTLKTITSYNLPNDNYKSLKIGIVNKQPYIIIIGKSKWHDLKACGTRIKVSIVSVHDKKTCRDI